MEPSSSPPPAAADSTPAETETPDFVPSNSEDHRSRITEIDNRLKEIDDEMKESVANEDFEKCTQVLKKIQNNFDFFNFSNFFQNISKKIQKFQEIRTNLNFFSIFFSCAMRR